ncbi:MAG: DUF4214 domain-containing protein, partial [Algicola sp.]|nr:DUF4214 domain-containing protein [Algicola sp.]
QAEKNAENSSNSSESYVALLADHLITSWPNGYDWQISDKHAKSGRHSLQTMTNPDGDSTLSNGWFEIQWNGYFEAGELTFDLYIHQSDGSSFFYVYIDDEQVASFGNSYYQQFKREVITVPKGVHTLRLAFSTDRFYLKNETAAWVDNLLYFAHDFDGDNDGMLDQWEFESGLDYTKNDASLDPDNDGLTNLQEFELNTDVHSEDSDGDGLSDYDEVYLYKTNPAKNDTDDDGINDGVEIQLGYDPNEAADVWLDEDGDRMPVFVENQESADTDLKDNDVFTNNRLLVQQAHRDMQRRFIDESELSDWVARLDSGLSTPIDLYLSFLDPLNNEHLGFIGRAYLACLNREVQLPGLHYFLKQLQRGMDKQSMIDVLIYSGEFEAKYGGLSNRDFVRRIYLNVLGRTADEDGLNYHSNKLDSGELQRNDLMLIFIDSWENVKTNDAKQRVDILSLLLTGVRPTGAQQARYLQWVNSYGHGSDSMLRALLASTGYRKSLMATITNGTDDTDNDGIPDGIEFIDGNDITLNDNPVATDNRAFVRQMLRDLTGEAYSNKTIDSHLEQLDELGDNRTDWTVTLLDTEAFTKQRQAISRLYYAFFLRQPDSQGLIYWIHRFDDGLSLPQIADEFAKSAEFQARYGSLSNEAFVNLVYQNVLGRLPDSTGLNYWKGRLDNASISPGGLMVGFSESNENINNTLSRGQVTLLFNLLLHRNANDSEFTFWHDLLKDGADVTLLVEELIGSNEYMGRFY